MGYKLLGFIVWQGGKLYLRRRTERAGRKGAIVVLGALVIGGVLFAQRQHSSD
jgi:hypothetical protein